MLDGGYLAVHNLALAAVDEYDRGAITLLTAILPLIQGVLA